jgi:cell division transport system permease protein
VAERNYRRRLRSWARRQLYSFFSSLGNLLAHRLGTLMTILVLGLAMALPLGLHLVVKNLEALDLKRESWGSITVFLDLAAGEREALALAAEAGRLHGAQVESVSPAAGMLEFGEASGLGQALDLFDENPLPWVLHVTPHVAEGGDLEAAVAALAGWLEAQGAVELVQVDHKWLQRLESIMTLGQALSRVLGLLFSLAVVVVVANTIRLDVSGQSAQIQVLNMVGAPNGFIRQPFLYSGLWYGLSGALLALALLEGSLLYLRAPVEQLLDAYGNRFSMLGLDGFETAAVLASGGLLGLLGSWLAVRHHLKVFGLPEVPRRKRSGKRAHE